MLLDIFRYTVLAITFFLFPYWWPTEDFNAYFLGMIVLWIVLIYLDIIVPSIHKIRGNSNDKSN